MVESIVDVALCIFATYYEKLCGSAVQCTKVSVKTKAYSSRPCIENAPLNVDSH